MRVLAVLSVDFCEWPLGFLEALASNGSALDVTGVVIIDRTVREHVRGRRGAIAVDPLHCVTDLEAGWSESRGLPSLEEYERVLGRDVVAHIGIADRELSSGWVSGGVFPRSPLADIGSDPARRHAYLAGLLAFVMDLFESGNFDAVLSPPPQDAAGVAIAHVAAHFGVRFLTPKAIGLGEKMCLFDDAVAMNPCFRSLYEGRTEEPAGFADRLEEARRWLHEFRERPAQPEYMRAARRMTFEPPTLTTLAALAWRTVQRRAPEALAYPYPWSRLRFELSRWFRTLEMLRPRFSSRSAIGSAPFAYYALHYEPELSVSVASPTMTDQLAVIESISKSIPGDWRLVVKEHVPMLGRRPPGYLRRLREMPNVVLVSPFEDGFALIRDARLVLTLTGTVGLEAVLLRRRTIFFGPSPIQIIGDGFVRCRHLGELDAAIDMALDQPAVEDASLVRFLACVFDASVDLPADLYWGGVSHVTQQLVAAHPHLVSRMGERLREALAATE